MPDEQRDVDKSTNQQLNTHAPRLFVRSRLLIHFFFAYSILTVVSIFHLMVPDMIPLNGGFSSEPAIYYKPIILDFPGQFWGHAIDPYTIQRVLPYAVIHYAMTVCRVPFSDTNILTCVGWYQFLILSVGSIYWLKLANKLDLGTAAFWLGSATLFFNFPTLKLDFYTPATYDRSSLIIGLVSFYYYVCEQPVRLWITSVLALAVWPTTILYNSILLLFGREAKVVVAPNQPNAVSMLAIALAVFGLISAITLGLLNGQPRESVITPPVMALMPISVPLAVTYLAAALFVLIGRVDLQVSIKAYFQKGAIRNVLLVAALLGCYLLLTKGLASHQLARFGIHAHVINIGLCSVSRPLIGLVSHVIYFGPSILLGALLYKQYCEEARSLGLGAVLALALAVCQSTDSESRQLLNVWTLMVVPFVLLVQRLNPSLKFVITFVLVSLVLSGFWLPINQFAPKDPSLYRYFPVGDVQHWSSQICFLHSGPWMSNFSFGVNVLLTGAMLLWLYCSYKSNFVNQKQSSDLAP